MFTLSLYWDSVCIVCGPEKCGQQFAQPPSYTRNNLPLLPPELQKESYGSRWMWT